MTRFLSVVFLVLGLMSVAVGAWEALQAKGRAPFEEATALLLAAMALRQMSDSEARHGQD